MRMFLLVLFLPTSLALGASREDCSQILVGRKLRTLSVESNWNDIAFLKTRTGQTIVAYEDDNFHVRVDDLHAGKTLWKVSTRNYVPKIALSEGKRGQIKIMLSRVLPKEGSATEFVIETEIIKIPSGERTLRTTQIGAIRGKLVSHAHFENGQEVFFVQGKHMAVIPLGGEPLTLGENEIANIPEMKISGRGTILLTTFNSGMLEALELKNKRFISVWKVNAESYGRIISEKNGVTRIVYKAQGRLIIRDPFNDDHIPMILPSSNFQISSNSAQNGDLLIATENMRGDQRSIDIYNISLKGKLLFSLPLENRPQLFAMAWASAAQGEIFVHAESDKVTVYQLMNDEAKILKTFKAEIGAGNLRFHGMRGAQYLLTPARHDGKVFVYNVLKDLGESR